jgi:hypothetical protein
MTVATESVVTETKALISRATAIKVSNPPTRQDAATLWSLIRTARKATEAEQDRICGPLKKEYEDKRRPYLELRKECESWETRLQAAMAAFDREQDRLARLEQERLQAIIDKKNEKIVAKAEEKGIEPVLKVAPVVQAPPKSIETQAGTTQTRTTKKVYKPTNLATLMKDFPQLFSIDMPKFNALAKTGILDGRADVSITEEYIYTQRS